MSTTPPAAPLDNASLRDALIPVLMKFGSEFDPIERLKEVNAVTDKALVAIMSLVQRYAKQKVASTLQGLLPDMENYVCSDCQWTKGKHSMGCCGVDGNYWNLVKRIETQVRAAKGQQ